VVKPVLNFLTLVCDTSAGLSKERKFAENYVKISVRNKFFARAYHIDSVDAQPIGKVNFDAFNKLIKQMFADSEESYRGLVAGSKKPAAT